MLSHTNCVVTKVKHHECGWGATNTMVRQFDLYQRFDQSGIGSSVSQGNMNKSDLRQADEL